MIVFEAAVFALLSLVFVYGHKPAGEASIRDINGPLDYAVLGQQKSGTSSLWMHLSVHPDVASVGERKETLWFNGDWPRTTYCDNDLDYYQQAVAYTRSVKNRPHVLVGDWSATHLSCLCCPLVMKMMNPKMKLIAVLRDPVQRTLSRFLEQKVITFGPCHAEVANMTFRGYVTAELQRLEGCLSRARAVQGRAAAGSGVGATRRVLLARDEEQQQQEQHVQSRGHAARDGTAKPQSGAVQEQPEKRFEQRPQQQQTTGRPQGPLLRGGGPTSMRNSGARAVGWPGPELGLGHNWGEDDTAATLNAVDGSHNSGGSSVSGGRNSVTAGAVQDSLRTGAHTGIATGIGSRNLLADTSPAGASVAGATGVAVSTPEPTLEGAGAAGPHDAGGDSLGDVDGGSGGEGGSSLGWGAGMGLAGWIEAQCYAKSNIVGWSVYDVFLDNYLAHFPSEQLLVLYTEDLAHRPMDVVRRVERFLGLRPGNYSEQALGLVYNSRACYAWSCGKNRTELRIGSSLSSSSSSLSSPAATITSSSSAATATAASSNTTAAGASGVGSGGATATGILQAELRSGGVIVAGRRLATFFRPHMLRLLELVDQGRIAPVPDVWRRKYGKRARRERGVAGRLRGGDGGIGSEGMESGEEEAVFPGNATG